jgi:hypothetical protein
MTFKIGDKVSIADATDPDYGVPGVVESAFTGSYAGGVKTMYRVKLENSKSGFQYARCYDFELTRVRKQRAAAS